MSDLSLLSGVKRKSDFWAIRSAFDPQATWGVGSDNVSLPDGWHCSLTSFGGEVMRRREFIKLVCTGALAAPLPASAQKQTTSVIGLLTTTTPDPTQLGAILKGLGERGYVDGRNLTVMYRSAEGTFERLPALARDLVERHVSLIFAFGSPVPARLAMAITTTMPIVFAYGGDPVVDGLVASLNRPGGNVTGATFLSTALSGKRLELLGKLLPQMTDVALLVNRKGTLAENQIRDAESATQTLGQRLISRQSVEQKSMR
jgi:putative tryptophan/tyrosine transport system substrate-binding protein